MKNLFSTLFVFFVLVSLKGQNAVPLEKKVKRFAFYNVENLFDTIDDPQGRDEEFLPASDKEWTVERYEKKLTQLATVFKDLNYPHLIGVCEVENERVMTDLAATDILKKHKYQSVHFESPDYRGIDVGFLYKKKAFKILEKDVITINFPPEIVEDYTTRDVLVVKGVLCKKDTLTIFINHWPSRRGGLKASSPKREYVAAQVRARIDKILAQNPNEKIILTGDFNDEPDNKSVAEVLMGKPGLQNAMATADENGEGTYNYRGNWNMIDQFIISNTLGSEAAGIRLINAGIFRGDYLFYTDKKYGKRPSRTYGGKRYFGGYSDHLPIYIDLK